MARKPITPSRQNTAALIDGKAQAVAMYRVSTLSQANTSADDEGFSIQAQREYCERKAGDISATIVREFIDRGKSARTANRPGLQELLQYIEDDPDIQYVIVHKLDRLARNRADDVALNLFFAKHGVKLVSATENIDDTPSGKLVHGIMSDIAEFYSANLSEEAKKGLRKKVDVGGTPGKAPIGYKNVRDTRDFKNIGIVVVDDFAGPLVTKAFELYDTGICTIADITDALNDAGLRLPANRKLPERRLRPQTVHHMLHNKYYTGIVTYNGVESQGEHTPLIDMATFERVNALLAVRDQNKDKSRKRPHHLKGNLFCAVCGRRLGIVVPTNRHGNSYPYFYCLGRQSDKASCSQGYMPIGEVEQSVRAYWKRVHLPAERITAIRQAVLENFAGKHATAEVEVEQHKARITKLERERQKNKEAYYADAIELPEFKADQDRIRREIASTEHQIAKLSIELGSITRALDEALSLLEDPQALYDATPDGLKTLLVQTVFEKIWIMDGSVAGTELTEPFEELLTLEARMAVVEEAASEPHSDEQGSDEAATYYRTGSSVMRLLSGLEDSWERLHVERPQGFLPVDGKNPRPRRVVGSNLMHLVGVTGLEPATSRPPAVRATNCATPRKT